MGAPARNPQLETTPIAEYTSAGSTRKTLDSTIKNFSIVVGGPVYDFLLRFRMVRLTLPNVARRIILLVALSWLPLLLLTLIDGVAFGQRVKIPFLYDFSVYGRFLVGLPLLLLAEVMIDPAIRLTLREFIDARLVKDDALPKFEEILLGIQRLRDSAIPELVLLALAFFPVFSFQQEWKSGAIPSWHTIGGSLTAAGWWYAAFSAPLLRFIAYRWAFRYFVWGALVWRIGRLPLVLMPTHPDHAGGLNFLCMTQKHFGVLFCALGCSFAGRVANSLVFEGAPLASFKSLMLGFVVLSVIIGLLPLGLLAPKLTKVRRAGLLEYGRLANRYTEGFDRKWVHYDEQPSEALLGNPDLQSLADLGNSFSVIEKMTIVPITKMLVLQLMVQAAIPLIPLIILGTPTGALVDALMKMVL